MMSDDMITIQPAHSQLKDWELLLRKCSSPLIYFTHSWSHFIQKVTGATEHHMIAYQGENPVGFLPLWSTKSGPNIVMNSQPWYGTHGGCLLVDPSQDDVRASLLAAAAKKIKELQASAFTCILTPSEEAHRSLYQSQLETTTFDSRIGQISTLPRQSQSEDSPHSLILQHVKQKTRNLIRKSLKQDFEVHRDSSEESWRFLFDEHQKGILAKGGQPKPWSHFTALRETIPMDQVRLYIATHESTKVAALLLLRYRDTVEYLTPVTSVDWRAKQPLSFLIYHAMADAISDGYSTWNWGGTWHTQHSLHHFKRGWGAEDKEYSYVIYARESLIKSLQAERMSVPWFYLYPYDKL